MNNIRKIASKIRKQCERFAKSDKAQGYDFHKCNDLSCMCAVASFALCEALRKNGIKSKVVSGRFFKNPNEKDANWGEGHCWVKVDNKIVDITATQFDALPKVYIVSSKSGKYRNGKIVKDYEDLKSWGKSQQPTSKLTKKIITLTA